MKKSVPVLAVITMLAFVPAVRPIDPADAVPAIDAPSASIEFAQVPLYFVRNKGQHAPEALFSAAPPGYTLWMTKDGLVFDSSRKAEAGGSEGARSVSRLTFLGASAAVDVEAVEPDPCRVNYFKGADSAGWISDIPTSRAVRYRGIYPATDLKVYGTSGAVEYDWVVQPGGDPGLIRFKYEASGGARLSAEGDLVVSTAFGDLVHHRPVCYQDASGGRRSVPAAFKDIGEGAFGFEVGAYDPGLPLVIDPVVLVSSTFIGGAKRDRIRGVAVDSRGAIYAAGATDSSDFPALKGYDSKLAGTSDAVLLKFASDAKTLVFATFFGGSAYDTAMALALDRRRTIWIAGQTDSTDLPTKDALDAKANGKTDIFLARFNAAGDKLLLSTYLGGTKEDSLGTGLVHGLAVGVDSSVCIVGKTESANFPVQAGFQSSLKGKFDGFVTKLAPGGKSIAYSTYLGGRNEDQASDVALGRDGAAYVTGWTASTDYPVQNAYDPSRNGREDVFVSKLDSGGGLVYSTFIGGTSDEMPEEIAVDAEGAAFIGGWTYSNNFPVKGGYDSTYNHSTDGFLLKLSPSGQSLEYSTYLGADRGDSVYSIALDSSGAVWAAGITSSSQFPLKNPIDKSLAGVNECFLAKLSRTGAKLEFSTFLGGKSVEYAWDLAVSAAGIVVVGGETDSTDFPVFKPYAGTYKGETDGFLAKYQSTKAAAKKR